MPHKIGDNVQLKDSLENAPETNAQTPTVSSVAVRNLQKTFARRSGEVVSAVDNLSINIEQGDFIVLLGPSGCGKTTLLRLIAGLETPDDGTIEVSGSVVFDQQQKKNIPPERRPVGMVFQSYALWPHMSVLDNVMYPLKNQRLTKVERLRQSNDTLQKVGITALGQQFPGQLSGGQQQRVALARAMASAEGVLLFDEPLSNIDAKVRDQLRFEIVKMQKDLNFTAIYVTHDQEEAMMLGTKIAVLRDGKIAQFASPAEIYRSPASAYVADFVGAADEFAAEIITQTHNEIEAKTHGGNRFIIKHNRNDLQRNVRIMARPEHWRFVDENNLETNSVKGIVELSKLLTGSRTEYHIKTADGTIRLWLTNGPRKETGTPVVIAQDSHQLLVFPREEK